MKYANFSDSGLTAAVAIAAALLLGTTSRALAQEPPFPISVAEITARGVETFTLMDSNGDAVVTFEEFSAVDPETLAAGRSIKNGPHRPRMPHHPGGPGPGTGDDGDWQAEYFNELFLRLDSDGDGMLSAAEFAADNQQQARRALHQERMFARLDSNHDKVLTLEELPGQRLILRDTDGDGQITRMEMHSGTEHRFDKPADKPTNPDSGVQQE